MGMPITTTTYGPSTDLVNHLKKLAEIAACAELLGQRNLKNQVETAYNNLVDRYNQSCQPKKRGFWGQLKENLLFTDLNREIYHKLNYLDDSSDYGMFLLYGRNKSIYELKNRLEFLINTLR